MLASADMDETANDGAIPKPLRVTSRQLQARTSARTSRLEIELLNLARNRIAADAQTLGRFHLAATREIQRLANHGRFETAREFVHDVGRVLAQQARDFGTQPAFPGPHGRRPPPSARGPR